MCVFGVLMIVSDDVVILQCQVFSFIVYNIALFI